MYQVEKKSTIKANISKTTTKKYYIGSSQIKNITIKIYF